MTPLLTSEEQKAAESAAESGLFPDGIYTCRVSDVERWSTGTSLCWKFRIAKGQKGAGHEFWTWTGLKESGIWKTKEILTALGFSLDADPDDIVGTPCKVMIVTEARTDTGEPSNKVKKVFAYDGPELPNEYDDSDTGFGDDEEDLV